MTDTALESADHDTVSTVLRGAADQLRPGSATARLDAELLMQQVTGLTRTQLRTSPERQLTPDELSKLRQLIDRRRKGEPVAYLLGEREFWSLTLQVTPAVLIPRPDTELLVERALQCLPRESPVRVLDLGTGSGAIALAIASERANAQVIAVDLSEAALQVARHNAATLQLDVEFRHGDWYDATPGERFDVIVSNPPYVAADDPALAADVAAYEPTPALIAGSTGMESLQRIAAGAPHHLAKGGRLLLEHGWQQGPKVRELLVQLGFSDVASRADLAGHERITEGRWTG